MSINPAAAPVAILPSVEPGLVHRAAVSFLDQFISRGAAQDVRQLRDQLASDGRTKKALLDQLPSQEVDDREAFDAFRRFLAAELERSGSHGIGGGPDLAEMVSWTEYDWGDGDTTSDPAQWHDWLGSVETARRAA